MTQSVSKEVRGIERATRRLENATKEWEEAYKLYAAALDQLKGKVTTKKLA